MREERKEEGRRWKGGKKGNIYNSTFEDFHIFLGMNQS